MLTRDAFWDLIGTLGGTVDEERAQTLTVRLTERAPGDIVAFADPLAQALYELDSPQHAAQLVIDPTADDEPMSMSDDLFLYARCAVVAAGRRTFDRVLADPSQLAGSWPVFDGEFLLGVAPQAYQAATGEDYDHESPVSYETGTNAALWGTPDLAPVTAIPPAGGTGHWLTVSSRSEDSLPWRAAHVRYQEIYFERIAADPAWRAWWAVAGIPSLDLQAWLIPDGQPEYRSTRKSRSPGRPPSSTSTWTAGSCCPPTGAYISSTPEPTWNDSSTQRPLILSSARSRRSRQYRLRPPESTWNNPNSTTPKPPIGSGGPG